MVDDAGFDVGGGCGLTRRLARSARIAFRGAYGRRFRWWTLSRTALGVAFRHG